MSLLDPRSPLATELERGRDRFNQAVVMAQRQGLRLSTDALGLHLCENVAPAIAEVARVAPERTRAVTEALFDLSLELVAKDVVGPDCRHPEVSAAWRSRFPRVAPALALEPQRVAAAITNAVYNLAAEPSARATEWTAAIGDLASLCTSVDTLLDVGTVLAWRSGMAHYRQAALDVWETLPDEPACAAFGVDPRRADSPGTLAAVRAGLRVRLGDPWTRPDQPPEAPALRVVATVGGFRGFGGTFISPPFVYASGGVLWARDADNLYSLHADCYGQCLRKSAVEPPEERKRNLCRLEADGVMTFRGLTARLPQVAEASGFAAIEALVAVTLPRSHRILLVARVGGDCG